MLIKRLSLAVGTNLKIILDQRPFKIGINKRGKRNTTGTTKTYIWKIKFSHNLWPCMLPSANNKCHNIWRLSCNLRALFYPGNLPWHGLGPKLVLEIMEKVLEMESLLTNLLQIQWSGNRWQCLDSWAPWPAYEMLQWKHGLVQVLLDMEEVL